MLILIPRGSWPTIAADLRDVLDAWQNSVERNHASGRALEIITDAYLVAQDAVLERSLWSDAKDWKEARARFARDEGMILSMHCTRITRLIATRHVERQTLHLGWRQLYPTPWAVISRASHPMAIGSLQFHSSPRTENES